MREILFRGKRADNGEWIEGSFTQDRDLEICSIDYFEYYYDDGGLQRDFCQYEVDPTTVGQYTGLPDKNGKKIFEGDIVRGYNTFHEREEQYVSAWEGNGFYLFDDCGSGWHPEHIAKPEVIGNITDNPELLKGDNNDDEVLSM